MPTYEYECIVCGHVFDVFHSMTAKPRVKCEECGGRTKKRIGAGAGIIFKGSGFYETDYKRGSAWREEKKAAETVKETPSESKKGESSTESTKSEKSKEA